MLLILQLVTRLAAAEPLALTPSSDFFGYDGLWSTVDITIGSESQRLSLLPSTSDQEIWVVGPASCPEGSCSVKRGGIFSMNESLTFEEQDDREFNIGERLPNTGYKSFGSDFVNLNDTTPIGRQLVGVINSNDKWIGTLGLGLQLAEVVNNTNSYQPLLSSLVQQGAMIPSHSYGYTAGASYRLNGTPASLTLGGVDLNRFATNDIMFELESKYTPAVWLRSISVSTSTGEGDAPPNWKHKNLTLFETFDANLFAIDSSTPYLWLPESGCDTFATALNLTYNETIQLYELSNNSTPASLLEWNLTFNFVLSTSSPPFKTLTLTVPYDAFNLQLTYPVPNLNAGKSSSRLNYFPLRKAADPAMYTLGRAFLQEVYMMVDYERNRFSLSQAVFQEDAAAEKNILSITRPEHSIWPAPITTNANSLSTGRKVAIGIGGVTGLILGVLGTYHAFSWCFKVRVAVAKLTGEVCFNSAKWSLTELAAETNPPAELRAGTVITTYELPANHLVELPADAGAVMRAEAPIVNDNK